MTRPERAAAWRRIRRAFPRAVVRRLRLLVAGHDAETIAVAGRTWRRVASRAASAEEAVRLHGAADALREAWRMAREAGK